MVWGLVSGSVKTSAPSTDLVNLLLTQVHYSVALARETKLGKRQYNQNQKYCNHQCNDNKFFDRLVEPVVQTQIRLLLEEPSDLDNNTVLA